MESSESQLYGERLRPTLQRFFLLSGKHHSQTRTAEPLLPPTRFTLMELRLLRYRWTGYPFC